MDAPAAPTPSAVRTILEIREQQNFPRALAAGIATALVGAALWAMVTVATGMQLGLAAVAVGYLVGQAIKFTGHGADPKFGYLGATCSLLACVIGNLMTAIAFYARARAIGITEVLAGLNTDLLVALMARFSQPMDLVFYAIGIYEGYKFSFKYRLAKTPAPVSQPGV